tara:strand:- start:2571 stop:3218 length:648 start_codon:yes stop_codon:yes gene_type:complete
VRCLPIPIELALGQDDENMTKKQKKVMSEGEKLRLIDRQLHNIHGAIRSLAYFRIISSGMTDDRSNLFWKSTKSVHIEHFVAAWSKCFGAQSEDLHWKKIVNDPCSFRTRLCKELGLEKHEFKKYNKQLLSFRNKIVAHTDTSLQQIDIPSFDSALNALAFLQKELVSELSKFKTELAVHRGPADVFVWYDNMIEEAGGIIGKAIEATSEIDEYH